MRTENTRPAYAMRVLEGIVVTVMGGLVLRFVTMPKPNGQIPLAEMITATVATPLQTAASNSPPTPLSPVTPPPTVKEEPAPKVSAMFYSPLIVSAPALDPPPVKEMEPPKKKELPEEKEASKEKETPEEEEPAKKKETTPEPKSTNKEPESTRGSETPPVQAEPSSADSAVELTGPILQAPTKSSGPWLAESSEKTEPVAPKTETVAPKLQTPAAPSLGSPPALASAPAATVAIEQPQAMDAAVAHVESAAKEIAASASGPSISSAAKPAGSAPSASVKISELAPRPQTALKVSTPTPTVPMAAAKTSAKGKQVSKPVPAGTVLLYENFLRFREGEATDWGPGTYVKTGTDRRHWIVTNVNGVHPVARNLRLPDEFHFECRYSAYMPEVNRGLLGWWKEPISTRISFLNAQGVKQSIEWTVRLGNDAAKLNPLGSPSLYAKKYYHTIKLPGGTANEIGLPQPNGRLSIDRDKDGVSVSIDGQPVVVGTIHGLGQLVGFEVNLVKAACGTLFFTEFRIVR